jgi:hypothetical protein
MSRDLNVWFFLALLISGGGTAIAGLHALHRRHTVYLLALAGTLCFGAAIFGVAAWPEVTS